MALDLTDRQTQVLKFLRERDGGAGSLPSIREVMRHLGLKNPRGAESHLRALARKGFVDHMVGRIPAYRLKPTPAEPRGDVGSAASPAAQSSRRIPILGRVPAGSADAQDVDDLGEIESPTPVSRGAFGVRVYGDSMRDAHIIEGDVAVVDPNVRPTDRGVVVALVDGGYTIKTFRLNSKDEWWLEPANEDHKPILPKVEGDRVVGSVVSIIRPSVARSKRAAHR